MSHARVPHRVIEARPESVMKEVLVSGCDDVQYSYDAKIGNRYHGAMTYYALRSLEAAKWSTDYKTWVPRHQRAPAPERVRPEPATRGPHRGEARRVFR